MPKPEDATRTYVAGLIVGYLAAMAELTEPEEAGEDGDTGFYVLQHDGGPAFWLVGPFDDGDAADEWGERHRDAVSEFQVVEVDPDYPDVMTPREAEEFLGTVEDDDEAPEPTAA